MRTDRRHFLLQGTALVSVAALFGGSVYPVFAQTPPVEGLGFQASSIIEQARALSRKPYVAPASDLPDVFSNLNYDQYVSIKPLPSVRIWNNENHGFKLEPLHRGFVFSNPVTLYVIENGQTQRITYDTGQFDFGRIVPPVPSGDIGFSGFRLYAPTPSGEAQEFAIVQGLSFFRAMARDQNFGVMARALSVRPADARGEEFPVFRAFWLEKPLPATNAIVAHGLFDSESVTGYIRMTFRPGEATIVDVETILFPRVALDHIGFGGMGSTYYFGPNDRRNVDDARAAAYESTGLQILNGQGEWLWRPLQNPETLQISAFIDQNPKGFGLLQRNRQYFDFQDDNQHFERRPSLWIEPIEEWGQGSVQLIEIPTDSEVNDNILAYWRPKSPLIAGSEVNFSYRQFWNWTPPNRPPLAVVSSTRVGRGSNSRKRRYYVDFTGDILAVGSVPADIKPVLSSGSGALSAIKTWTYPEQKTMRVVFDLDPGSEVSSELRLLLEAGGKPVSETWLYRWTPG